MKYDVTPGWLSFHPNPSVPTFTLPAGAVDAHCHVFGPGEEFPYASERKYTPCDAPKDKLWELRIRGKSGISRAIYVTASGQRVVIVRVFVKKTQKTQKTPNRELRLARERAKEVR